MSDTPGLGAYRKTIDHLDRAMMCLLAERCRMVAWAGERTEAWEELGHYEQGSNLNLGRSFIDQFGALLDEAKDWPNTDPLEQDQDFGASLYTLDLTLFLTLSERFKTVRRIGRIKRIYQVQPLDSARWDSLLQARRQQASGLGLDPDWTSRLFETIHEYALELEGDIQS